MYKPLVFVLAIIAIVTNVSARLPLFLEQDFENTNVFIGYDPFAAGIGNGDEVEGLFQGLNSSLSVIDGDFYPETDPNTSSSFTVGSQSVRIKREFALYNGEPMNVGALGAKRTNHELTGAFHAEFSIKIDDSSSQFQLGLADSDGGNISQVAVAYYSGILHTRHDGAWKAKTSGVVQGEWFKIAFVGDVNLGTYSTYIDFGRDVSYGWIAISTDDQFDNTAIANIAGFVFAPWLNDFEFCLDDVRIFGEYDVPVSCGEALDMGYGFAGDINGDCEVSLEDLELLVQDWLNCADPQNTECTPLLN